MKRTRISFVLLSAALIAGAQEPQPSGTAEKQLVKAVPANRIFSTFDVLDADSGLPGNLVKGAPYAAETVTETTQTLGDGNRIFRKNTAAVYRDSEGRTRRETEISSIGPLAATNNGTKLVFIHDPTENVNYTLNEKEHVARKFSGGGIHIAAPMQAPLPMPEGTVMTYPAAGMSLSTTIRRTAAAEIPKGESLGTKILEGLKVEGTRTTHTIHAGEIGNDRPIEIVSERWYSPELKLVVMSRNSDPRMGETIFKLTNLRRDEPMRALFQIPAGYTLSAEPAFERAVITNKIVKVE